MNGTSGFSEESLRKIAAQKVIKIHIAFFIFVNILLFIINCLFTPDFYWIVIFKKIYRERRKKLMGIIYVFDSTPLTWE